MDGERLLKAIFNRQTEGLHQATCVCIPMFGKTTLDSTIGVYILGIQYSFSYLIFKYNKGVKIFDPNIRGELRQLR